MNPKNTEGRKPRLRFCLIPYFVLKVSTEQISSRLADSVDFLALKHRDDPDRLELFFLTTGVT